MFSLESTLSISSIISLQELQLIVTVLFATFWSFMWYTRNWRTRRSRLLELSKRLPGPPCLPIVGNALRFACKSEELLDRIAGVIVPYENVTPMKVWMGPALYVVITAPHDIEIILNSRQALNKGMAYKFLFPFIGDGLISGSGNKWKLHRKIVSHTLSPRILRYFVQVFEKHVEILMKKLLNVADGRTFDIFKFIEGCTVDIVCETVMGCNNVNSQDNLEQDFVLHTAEMHRIIHTRMMKIWLYPDFIFKFTELFKKQRKVQKAIRDFMNKCIDGKRKDLLEKKQRIDGSNDSRSEESSILGRVLEINEETNELSDEELRDEMFTVYIASQDTLAVTCSFATLMLAIHQEIQEKARREIQEILVDDKSFTAESLNRMKYVEMIAKETLRLFPIAPLIVRRLSGEISLESCTLPEGCEVVIASFTTQRSVKYWKNPEQFIPERFSAEEIAKRHPYAFIPFSGGPMGCIGQKFAIMSLKAILANILRYYRIKTNVKMEDIKLCTDISIRSINGYKVSLEPL